MEQADNLLLRIQKYDKTFSKGQKRLAAYVLKNYDKAVFLTASKLGKEVGVSESTTVRFATQLGYKGFPEFHRALEELVRNKLNSIQRMKVTYGHVPEAIMRHLRWRWRHCFLRELSILSVSGAVHP